MAKAEIDMIDVAKQINVEIKVKNMAKFKLRTKLGMLIIKLGCVVLPTNTKIEIEEDL